jgi:hypothetical protein
MWRGWCVLRPVCYPRPWTSFLVRIQTAIALSDAIQRKGGGGKVEVAEMQHRCSLSKHYVLAWTSSPFVMRQHTYPCRLYNAHQYRRRDDPIRDDDIVTPHLDRLPLALVGSPAVQRRVPLSATHSIFISSLFGGVLLRPATMMELSPGNSLTSSSNVSRLK